MKKIFLLKDLSEDSVDAVIIAETSTEEEIESAICKAKEKDDYQWEDLVEALPDDCQIYDKWADLKNIYY